MAEDTENQPLRSEDGEKPVKKGSFFDAIKGVHPYSPIEKQDLLRAAMNNADRLDLFDRTFKPKVFPAPFEVPDITEEDMNRIRQNFKLGPDDFVKVYGDKKYKFEGMDEIYNKFKTPEFYKFDKEIPSDDPEKKTDET